MDVFLQIIGAIALLGILAIAAVAGWFWWKIHSFKKHFANLSEAPLPFAINMTETTEWNWRNDTEANALVGELQSHGFTPAECYTIEEMPETFFTALFRSDGVSVVVYRTPLVGVHCDICVNFVSGLEVSITNAPAGAELDTPPNTQKIFRARAPIEELVSILNEILQREGQIQPITRENFRSYFEEDYRKSMLWRAQKGGTSMNEFLKITAGMGGKPLSEEELQFGFLQTKQLELERIHDACLTNFKRQTVISVNEWESYEGCFITVSESMDPETFATRSAACLALSEDESEEFTSLSTTGISVSALFKRMVERLPVDRRPKALGKVSEPVLAEIHGVPPES